MIQPVNNQPMCSAPMMPYYHAQPQNNAVKIDIINPQAGATTNPYAMPQASAYPPYVPNAQYVPSYYPLLQQPQMPVQNFSQPIAAPMRQIQQPVQQPMPMVTPQPVAAPQTVAVPQPVIIPQPVVTAQPQQIINNAPVAAMPEPPQAQVASAQPEATPVETAEQTPVAPQVEAPASTPVNIDLNQVVSKLNSTNMDEQLAAIENIAETAQVNPTAATQLLDTQIMDALGNILKKDTTQMQGPTPEQIELRQKLLSGEQLTPEQTEVANKMSDMEVAERNKQFALYTIAILQKLLSTEVEKAQGVKLEMKDLPMINDIVKIAKADINPMLRASALAALSYIATPENKALLTTMFEQSKKDADPNVQAVAAEALNKLSQV